MGANTVHQPQTTVFVDFNIIKNKHKRTVPFIVQPFLIF